jgi:hypothetical protein
MFHSSVVVVIYVPMLILNDDSWFLQFLSLDRCHLSINFYSPTAKCWIILKFRDKFIDLFYSSISSTNLILLDVSHLALVSGKIIWKRGLIANLSRKKDRLTTSFSIIYE